MDKNVDEIINDRSLFSDFIYTPLEEAVSEFKKRQGDIQLTKIIESDLKTIIPSILKENECMILSRPVATPNYEFRRFISIGDTLEFKPIVWEYTDSKFVPQNETKYALARMGFFNGKGKKGGMKINYANVINIQNSSGKKISEIETVWKENLVDFHHNLFIKEGYIPQKNIFYYNASDWYRESGNNALECYPHFLALFLKHGILFENFLLDVKEYNFTKDIFLPAFLNVFKKTGLKPLIVALEPTQIEGDRFWSCYPNNLESDVKDLISKYNN